MKRVIAAALRGVADLLDPAAATRLRNEVESAIEHAIRHQKMVANIKGDQLVYAKRRGRGDAA